ncbi:MAG: cobalamin-binding protein [Thermoprotei archaeon]|nr:MAG: cobalamin-binding protein [Thermoprotei archaeon]
MESKHVAIILAVIVIVEAFMIGYMAMTNNQLNEKISQLQSDYQELLAKYNKLMIVHFPLSLIDDAGRVVVISSEPHKIVSMAPSITEVLFALNLSDRVIGVTRYCDYPPVVNEMKENGSLTVIGGYWDPNIEVIISLQPDLVIGYSSVPSHVDIADRLEAMNISVMLLDPHNLTDVFDNIILIGRATGKLREARELVDQLEARVSNVVEKVSGLPKVKVYYELWFNPLMSVGPGTFIDSLITMAGGENIFHDAATQYPIISSEDVITRNPDVIILPDSYMTDYNVSIDQITSRPGWSAINAVKNNKIYFIDEDLLVRPGPRLVDGLEKLAAYIHPEAFKS